VGSTSRGAQCGFAGGVVGGGPTGRHSRGTPYAPAVGPRAKQQLPGMMQCSSCSTLQLTTVCSHPQVLRKILSPVAMTTTLQAAAAAAATTAAAAAAKLQGIIRETGSISLEIMRSRPGSPTRPHAVSSNVNGTVTAEGSTKG
jgi:hypothetical protein